MTPVPALLALGVLALWSGQALARVPFDPRPGIWDVRVIRTVQSAGDTSPRRCTRLYQARDEQVRALLPDDRTEGAATATPAHLSWIYFDKPGDMLSGRLHLEGVATSHALDLKRRGNGSFIFVDVTTRSRFNRWEETSRFVTTARWLMRDWPRTDGADIKPVPSIHGEMPWTC